MASSTLYSSSISPPSPRLPSSSRNSPSKRRLTIIAMSTKNKVNRYDGGWKKQWYGAGLFAEASEEVTLDVVKKLEKKKVLSNVESAGLLTKAEELGFTLSSIEKLGIFSKAEELGLLSLLEKTAGSSPSVLASIALPLLLAAFAVVVFVPDDSTTLIAVQPWWLWRLVLAPSDFSLGLWRLQDCRRNEISCPGRSSSRKSIEP